MEGLSDVGGRTEPSWQLEWGWNREQWGGQWGGSRGDSFFVKIASWNIRDGHGGGLKATARRLQQMRVPIVVLQETKRTGGRHICCTSGYTVLASDVRSEHSIGVELVWV